MLNILHKNELLSRNINKIELNLQKMGFDC